MNNGTSRTRNIEDDTEMLRITKNSQFQTISGFKKSREQRQCSREHVNKISNVL